MDTADFHQELDRRLAIIEDPGYDDPAQADLPARDWILLLVGCVVVIGIALAWGYPW